MEPALADLPGTPETTSGNAVQQLIQTFTAPSKAFSTLGNGGTWWLPYLVILVLSLIFSFAIGSKVGWEQVSRNTIAASPSQQSQMANLTPEQRDHQIGVIAKITMYSVYIAVVFGPLIAGAIVAGVLLAALNFIMGGHAKFGRLFALWLFSSLPAALKGVLVSLTLFLGLSPESFQIQNPLGSNPAYYMAGSGTPVWLTTLLKSADVFTIWQVALLVIGCSIVAKLSRKQAAIIVVGLWLLTVLVGTGFAAAKG